LADNQLGCYSEFVAQFKIYRAKLAQARMSPPSIVPVVDPRCDFALGFAPRVPVRIVDEFALEGGEKVHDDGVLPTIAFSAHTTDSPTAPEQLLIRVARVLNTSITQIEAARG
jgi:hypothetical protein